MVEVTYKGRKYKVYNGSRGGHFIKVKGKKKYVNLKQKMKTMKMTIPKKSKKSKKKQSKFKLFGGTGNTFYEKLKTSIDGGNINIYRLDNVDEMLNYPRTTIRDGDPATGRVTYVRKNTTNPDALKSFEILNNNSLFVKVGGKNSLKPEEYEPLCTPEKFKAYLDFFNSHKHELDKQYLVLVFDGDNLEGKTPFTQFIAYALNSDENVYSIAIKTQKNLQVSNAYLENWVGNNNNGSKRFGTKNWIGNITMKSRSSPHTLYTVNPTARQRMFHCSINDDHLKETGFTDNLLLNTYTIETSFSIYIGVGRKLAHWVKSKDGSLTQSCIEICANRLVNNPEITLSLLEQSPNKINQASILGNELIIFSHDMASETLHSKQLELSAVKLPTELLDAITR